MDLELKQYNLFRFLKGGIAKPLQVSAGGCNQPRSNECAECLARGTELITEKRLSLGSANDSEKAGFLAVLGWGMRPQPIEQRFEDFKISSNTSCLLAR